MYLRCIPSGKLFLFVQVVYPFLYYRFEHHHHFLNPINIPWFKNLGDANRFQFADGEERGKFLKLITHYSVDLFDIIFYFSSLFGISLRKCLRFYSKRKIWQIRNIFIHCPKKSKLQRLCFLLFSFCFLFSFGFYVFFFFFFSSFFLWLNILVIKNHFFGSLQFIPTLSLFLSLSLS